MRLVAWNCAMALHRKLDALRALRPDVAVIGECAEPARLAARAGLAGLAGPPVWVGSNPNKGLAVITFNGYRAHLRRGHDPALRFVAPVAIEGPQPFDLLAVWAQNASDGIRRKDQPGPLRRALDRHRRLLRGGRAVVAGDFNNNVIWDRPGWSINHAEAVARLARHGLVSAYHALTGEAQGAESTPTHYWRDRREDGPTYHLDYIFLPETWLPQVTEFAVGDFATWCGSGFSDHLPLVIEVVRDRAGPNFMDSPPYSD